MNICLFDLDNTLIPIDSDYEWGNFLIKIKILNSIYFYKKNKVWYKNYLIGKLNIKKYLKFVFKNLLNFQNFEFKKILNKFIEKIIKPSIKLNILKLINNHIILGDLIIIITATNNFIAKPITKLLNIKNLISYKPQVINNNFTNNCLLGLPTYGIYKVINIKIWLQKKYKRSILNFKKSYFYSDSENDIPLLINVTNPNIVNYNKRFKKIAISNNWINFNLFKK